MKPLLPALYGLILLCCSTVRGQEVRKPLKPGETLPDINMRLFTGQKETALSTTSLKGKVVLLDFWGINCASCIAAMPRMLELQHQFKDDVQIILVTKNTKHAVDSFFKRYESHVRMGKYIEAGRRLPFVFADSIFYKLFPYNGIPTHVWVKPDQHYLATAYAETTTVENIRALLQNRQPKIDGKYVLEIDIKNPIDWLEPAKGLVSHVSGFSFFTTRLEAGRGTDLVHLYDSSGQKIGISILNKTLFMIYQIAIKDFPIPYHEILPDNRILVESKKWSFNSPGSEQFYEWSKTNTYSYAMKMPEGFKGNIYELMRTQLDQYLGLHSFFTKRKLKTFVLKKVGKEDLLAAHSNGHVYETKLIDGRMIMQMRNAQMRDVYSLLFDYAKYFDPSIPLIDETYYNGRIDIDLPAIIDKKPIPFQEIRQTLQKFGLDLVLEDRSLDVFVIEDR